MIHIVAPFPVDWVALAWKWIQEFPDANMDDFCPKTFDAFYQMMAERIETESTWGITKDGIPCGVVGYFPSTPETGMLHGICFAQGFLDREQKRDTFAKILESLFTSGAHKIAASYFASNQKVATFLADFGFRIEGYLSEQTKQHGAWIDMQLVALIKENICH